MKKIIQKGLAYLLTVCMLSSLICIPTAAADTMKMSLVFMNTSYEEITTASVGDTVYMGIKLEDYIPIKNYDWSISYNTGLLDFDEAYEDEEGDFYTGKYFSGKDMQPTYKVHETTGRVELAFAYSDEGAVAQKRAVDKRNITAYFAFTVKATGTANVNFNQGQLEGSNVIWSVEGADGNAIPTTLNSGSLNIVAANSISISGNTEIAVPLADGATPGSTEKQFTVSLTDANAADIANPKVTWTVEPSATGISIDETGKVTVTSAAAAGTYTVKAIATKVDNEGLGVESVTATKDITITKETSAPATVVLGEVGNTDIKVPATDADDVTIPAPSVSVYDQYGADVTSTSSVTWSISPADKAGVSINEETGLVTVTDDAKAAASCTTYTVTATVNGKADSYTFTVGRAASEVASVTIAGNYDNANIPADGAADVIIPAPTVSAVDQYGENATGIKWSIENAPDGVTIDEDTGVITVSANAADAITTSQTLTVKAEVGGKSATTTAEIKRATATLTTLTVSGPETGTITASDGTATYAVSGVDQYGSNYDLTGKDIVWSVVTANEGNTAVDNSIATIDDNILTIKGKAPTTTVYVKATVGSVSDWHEVTLTREAAQVSEVTIEGPPSAEIGVTDTTKTYTITAKDQFGETYSPADITWEVVAEENGTTTVPSEIATMSNGTLTIKGKATNSTVWVKVTADGMSKYFKVELARAASVLTSVKITGEASIIKPVGDTPKTITYTATAYDQYGAEMATNIDWTSNSTLADVTVRGYSVTVTKDSAEGTFTLKAAADSVYDELTITVTSKPTQAGFKFENAPSEKTYGDAAFTVAATGAEETPAITYASSDERVATVDSTGKVTIVGVGDVTITAKTAETATYAPTEASYSFTVSAKSVTITGLTAAGKTYDGNTAATATGTAVIDGKLDGDDVYVVAGTASFSDKNVGNNKTVTFTGYTLGGADAANYELSAQPASTTASISPASLTITGVTAATRNYEAGNLTVTLSGGSLFGLIDNDIVTADLTSAVGTIADANAGTDKPVTVTGIALTGTDAANYELTQPTVTVTINKIEWTATTASGSTKYGTTGSVDLAALLAPGGAFGTVAKTDADSVLSGDPAVADSKLSFTFVDDATKVGKTATVTIPVTGATNHNDYRIIITLTVADKFVPELTVEPITVTYTGEAVPADKIVGTAKYDGQDIPGTWSFADGQTLTNVADSGTKTVIFTPDASVSDDFKAAAAEVSVTINKAAVTGAPAYTRITASGKTLADAALTTVGGTFSVPGTVAWNDPTTTEVKANTQYGWTFTPRDTANYETLTGSLVVWAMSNRPHVPSGPIAPEVEEEKWDCDGGKKCPSKPFTDVNTALWYHQAVDFALTEGFMVGLSKDTFGPEVPVTRGMVVTVLWSIEGAPSAKASTFQDVAADAWYAKAVNWASAKGIVAGYSAEAFGPDDLITREQMATILRAYAYYKGEDISKANDLSGYADVDQIADWAKTSVAWANAEGLMAGRSATELAPKGTTKRAELAAMLMGFLAEDK